MIRMLLYNINQENQNTVPAGRSIGIIRRAFKITRLTTTLEAVSTPKVIIPGYGIPKRKAEIREELSWKFP